MPARVRLLITRATTILWDRPRHSPTSLRHSLLPTHLVTCFPLPIHITPRRGMPNISNDPHLPTTTVTVNIAKMSRMRARDLRPDELAFSCISKSRGRGARA
jgi:hypothetical protein